ncbi:MAG TPA: response regulator transcription factor [Myxococcaceae bacterium]|nr:response regulator transcription factor [Myxococcaceae bacterium]
MTETHPPSGIRVALLDDHALMRDALVDMLESEGVHVVAVAEKPEELLAKLASQDADVVLVDLMLEDGQEGRDRLEGLEVLRRLRESHPNVRPLIVSALDETEVTQQCLRAGAAGYLCKYSSSTDDVLAAIQSAYRGEPVKPVTHLPSEPGATGSGESTLSRLTPREREILVQVSSGAGNMEIARALGLSERTVKAHVSSIYRKLGVENRTELALAARRLGVRPLPAAS